jgi:integrase/recombinase XerC
VSAVDEGLADVVTLQRRRAAAEHAEDEEGFFADTLAEYRWARDAAGLAPSTLDQLIKPVIEVCEFHGLAPWRLMPRHLDQYFAGPGKRSRATVLQKINRIDGYFAFLEQRYAGEIARLFGAGVESPVDPFNRPRHRGDFGLRVPPSARAMSEFFARWRADLPSVRKYSVAARDYVMAKVAYLSGVRASELCGVGVNEVFWHHGQWGRFLVRGKGARGSGPRTREAYLFAEGRELLWWYVENVRGLFPDDPEHPQAPLWPSERLPAAALNLGVDAPCNAVTPGRLREILATAGAQYLTGPVTHLHPHLLRHACATHNYERGMSLWEVQKMLGHEWTSTTVRYLSTAHADPELAGPERAGAAAATRAAGRLITDTGRLR